MHCDWLPMWKWNVAQQQRAGRTRTNYPANPMMNGHHSTSASATNHNAYPHHQYANAMPVNMHSMNGGSVGNGNPSPASIGSNHTQRSTTPRSQTGYYPTNTARHSNSGNNSNSRTASGAVFMPSIGC